MKSPLLKPAPKIDFPNLPSRIPIINGAQTIQEKKNKIIAEFASRNIKNTASCFFEPDSDFSSNLHFIFRQDCKQMVFLRMEHFKNADISLHIDAEKNTEVHFVFLIKGKEESRSRICLTGNIHEKAKLTITGLHINKGDFNAEISTDMSEKDAACEILCAEIGQNEGKTDMQIENISSASHTSGKITTRCMLFDKAKARIQAVPTVLKKSEDCNNHLDQKTIILSPDARSESVPLLAIANNNVSASHKSSMARLNENDVFYFQTRGINRDAAQKLILDGFLTDIFPQIPEESVRRCMTEAAQHFLENR